METAETVKAMSLETAQKKVLELQDMMMAALMESNELSKKCRALQRDRNHDNNY